MCPTTKIYEGHFYLLGSLGEMKFLHDSVLDIRQATKVFVKLTRKKNWNSISLKVLVNCPKNIFLPAVEDVAHESSNGLFSLSYTTPLPPVKLQTGASTPLTEPEL